MSNTTTNTPAVKRGRPVVNGSKRQAVLAMREAKRAQGIEIKRGRPKMVKTDDVTVKVKAPKAKQSKADKQAKLKETVVEVPAANKKLTARTVNNNVAVMSIEDIVAGSLK
jgi:hypothetical protein